MPLSITAPELAALHISDDDGSYWFIVDTVAAEGQNTVIAGQNINIQRQMVTRDNLASGVDLPELNRARFFAGEDNPFIVQQGRTVLLGDGLGQIFMATRQDITSFAQFCGAQWLGDYINANFRLQNNLTICVGPSSTSFSPDMRQVVVAAMADGFSPGFSFTDSPLGFFGRYDGDDRAAGFTYDFDTFALRTDYTRLPSKQDSNVWLDTYRLGLLQPINDEARFFAGVDNYKNAILVIDTTGENLHRFGVAVGDGYAVKYEYRLNL